MRPRRWTAAHLIALVELVCGVGAAVYLIGMRPGGIGGRSTVDVLFPFVARRGRGAGPGRGGGAPLAGGRAAGGAATAGAAGGPGAAA